MSRFGETKIAMFDDSTTVYDREQFAGEHGLTIKHELESKFTVLNYNKQKINANNIGSSGIMRSVVIAGAEPVSFSPPKSINYPTFAARYMNPTSQTNQENQPVRVEEIVEGTMVNLFCFEEVWYLATKTKVLGLAEGVAADTTELGYCFMEMFREAAVCCKLRVRDLREDWSYSFVLQHPKHTIVNTPTVPMLYLIRAYDIDFINQNVSEHGGTETFVKNEFHKSTVRFPRLVVVPSGVHFDQYYNDTELSIRTPGLMIMTQSGVRTKIRNPAYEAVRHARADDKPFVEYLIRMKTYEERMLLAEYDDWVGPYVLQPMDGEYHTRRTAVCEHLYEKYVSMYITGRNGGARNVRSAVPSAVPSADQPAAALTTIHPKTLRRNKKNNHVLLTHLRDIQTIYYTELKPQHMKMTQSRIIKYIDSLTIDKLSGLYLSVARA